MESPIVSIIVPCYNQAHFLNDSLQSVLEQTYKHWECIIVNDGSTDNTEKVAKTWCAANDRFTYVQQSNKGLSGARNAGIAFSSGDYILPLDADDILHSNYLSRLVPIIEKEKQLSIISCYTGFFTKTPADVYFKLEPVGSGAKSMLYSNQLVATSLFRKSDWVIVGGYDERMKKGFEDWEFWLRILKLENACYQIVPEVLFYYRKSKESMLVDTVTNHFETVKKYIVQKHPELYISDFHNFTSVQFHYLQAAKNSEKAIKNSLEYKIGKVVTKPFRILKSWTNGSKP